MSKQLNNIVTSNPTVIEFTGKYKEVLSKEIVEFTESSTLTLPAWGFKVFAK